MNSLKTVVIVIVLAVVAGAVYVLINNNGASPTAPPELSDGWTSGPAVEIPDSSAPQSPFPSPGTAPPVCPTLVAPVLWRAP